MYEKLEATCHPATVVVGSRVRKRAAVRTGLPNIWIIEAIARGKPNFVTWLAVIAGSS